MTREEPGRDALEPYFAAARASEAGPPPALLNRILADAGDVAAARAPAATATPRVPSLAERMRRAFAPVGGWAGAAALGGFAAAGFFAGLAGGADAIQPAAVGFDGPTEAVVAFYDLAGPEG
jgi:hypothetical protein